MNKQIIVAFFSCLFYATLFCQSTDIIELDEVTVIDSLLIKDRGYKSKKIDSIAMMKLQYQTFAEMLSRHAPIFIKTYGQGGLSTASFRGTGASHTKVLWNNIEINSAMLGQADFSTLSLNMVDEVEILPGGSSIQKGGGALGGSIDIGNSSPWLQKNPFNVKISVGSFGTYSPFLSYKYGNNKWIARTKVSFLKSENNYSFLNNFKDRINPPKEERKDADFENYNFMQELYVKTNDGGLFSANLWVSRYYRNIGPPLSVGTYNREENQKNDDIRGFISWKKQMKDVLFSVQSAYLYNDLNYKNNISRIDSKNFEHKFIQQANINYSISERISLLGNLSYTHFNVQSNNYGDIKIRDEIEGFFAAEWTPIPHLNVRFNMREKLLDGERLPLIPSIGFDWKINQAIPLYLKANLSKNYREPNLNDLYWNPGGNAALKPEEGFSYETGLKFVQKNKSWRIEAEATYFDQFIDNWIIWLPDSIGNFWRPNNIREVRANGLETDAKIKYSFQNWNLTLSTGYNYTQSRNMHRLSSQDLSYKKQLIYVPKHSANGALYINYKKIGFHTVYHFTGKRYVNTDNTAYMPKFTTFDMMMDYSLNWRNYQLLIALKANNVFDYPYQIIAWYPMPGRSFMFSITLK